jgi:predicted porin
MKKAILAAAVALATSAASAQGVEVYGKMHVYGEQDRVGTGSAVTKLSNDLSRFGLRGSEKIGDLTAFFGLETNVAADAPGATSLGDRTAIVGLRNAFGSLAAGRDVHSVFVTVASYDPFDARFASSAATIHPLHATRFSNAAFVAATPVKGVTLSYQHGFSEVANGTDKKSFGADAKFGPLNLAAARLENGNDETNVFAGKFELKATGTTFHGLYSDNIVAGVASEGKTVGVSQKLGGPLTALAAYSENDKIKGYNVGAKYNLSKRTFLHARYRQETSDTASLERKQAGFGVEHNF